MTAEAKKGRRRSGAVQQGIWGDSNSQEESDMVAQFDVTGWPLIEPLDKMSRCHAFLHEQRRPVTNSISLYMLQVNTTSSTSPQADLAANHQEMLLSLS